jgi:magnesium transporter
MNLRVMPDWIAHGILDSVVDSFFPFLEEIEREIVGVEDYVYFKPCDRRLSPRDRAVTSQDTLRGDSIPNLGGALLKKGKTTTQTEEKAIVDGNIVTVAEHIPASPSGAELSLHRVLRRIWSRITQSKASVSSATTPTLHRMARTRRLVTSLVRLLATKSEVVAQIRKRPRNGNDNGDDAEVAMYMGDIQGSAFSRLIFVAGAHMRNRQITS